jgi:hypothetical protein|tara:strand:- start:2425 stop:2646 length:222 start_codon:yes stop_codon:yes gene_type:complete
MTIRYERDDANFILECLKDYKRLIKKYYSQNSVIVERVDVIIELAENAKLESIKEKHLPKEGEVRGATCEECE